MQMYHIAPLTRQVFLPLYLVSVPLVCPVTPWGVLDWECLANIPPYLPLDSLDFPPTYRG